MNDLEELAKIIAIWERGLEMRNELQKEISKGDDSLVHLRATIALNLDLPRNASFTEIAFKQWYDDEMDPNRTEL